MALAITILYSLALVYIFLFSMGQLHLTWLYIKERKRKKPELFNMAFQPMVTVQLPVYNEKYVVERLLDAVGKLNYPKDKLEIQVLDDSTDETTEIIRSKIKSMEAEGLDIKLLHRSNREGFKAGALDHGLQSAKGEFIVIFDADFIPEPDFLNKTLHQFQDTSVGAVQTRWAYINKDYSLLTQLQAFGLDAHFSIEQTARNAAGSFINFNGTCGLWRKTCIETSGGWSADTLTEDLDLSYRAQMNGWKFQYMEHISTPGELPVIMPAIKMQQYRWNKGGAETARKHIGKVLRSDAPLTKKIHAFFHLLNSSVFVGILIASVLSIPVLYFRQDHPQLKWLFNAGIVLLIGFLSISLFYWTATKRFHPNAGKKFFQLFPSFLIVSMGLSLHNGIAVIEGFLGIRTPFIRTPKFNIVHKKDTWKKNTYFKPSITLLTILEGLLCLYFVAGIILGIYLHDNALLIFHSMLALGFGSVFYHSVKPVAHA